MYTNPELKQFTSEKVKTIVEGNLKKEIIKNRI